MAGSQDRKTNLGQAQARADGLPTPSVFNSPQNLDTPGASCVASPTTREEFDALVNG